MSRRAGPGPAARALAVAALALAAACGGAGGGAGPGDAGGDAPAPDAPDAADEDGAPDDADDAGDAGPDGGGWTCEAAPGSAPDFLPRLGCPEDFALLASDPLDASIPGARSAKTVIDRYFDDALYVQNSKKYLVHWEFASAHLSGQGKPPVPPLGQFNSTEYYSPDRRFLLGAVTWYEEPGAWVYEISPYDTATAAMIARAYDVIAAHAFFGDELWFHPTSQAVEKEAANLPPHVRVLTTDELFAGITYQPLNLGTTAGRLRFLDAKGLASESLDYRDVVVLDHVPNDIGVVSGIITAALQTPLSHINVLSQNRGTPNMALLGAFAHEALVPLEGRWVELTVGPFAWSIREITQAEADAWWEAHKPEPVGVPALDLTETELRAVEDLLQLDPAPAPGGAPTAEALGEALARTIPAYGGKASHYAAFPYMGPKVPHPKAFAIPVFYYRQHMAQHGLDAVVDAMLEDPEFQGSPAVRAARLAQLQDAIEAAPLDPDLLDAVLARLATDFPGVRMRFRSSTNAEDLDGFTGAGLYTSKTGDPADPDKPVEDAIRAVWASLWNYKAYDERAYRSIDHRAVGMALLVHRSFPEEEANGVALTANIFDTTGLEPGFYINVQAGGASVVLPEPGVTTDQIIYHYQLPGQPVIFLSHSSLVPPGETVLTNAQLYALGQALERIHGFFRPLYGPPPGQAARFYAMDVEFKLEGDPGEAPALFVKQARPHPGWGL